MIANSTPSFLIDALVFDAYGTLFDVQSVAATVERLFPGRGAALSQLWRTKQLEYTWLQSLMQSPMQRREDFAAVTAHALDYAA
ncbi:MAG TPA: HAD-IA family hydrolase [Casimicrobiaceae bacterium]